jgi:superfamily I DNA/RNA helicase/CRISPR/Cas system-associated exonuclease Cas4 (RecB family)
MLLNQAVIMAGLKLIKASAGSGKTYTLTNEYIDLLFKKERAYRNILAVTFTNKATEEMKRRVVERLHERSLTDELSAKILSQILHDYSSFSISTIDRFFQQTMRAFAREIGKNGAYNVELDTDMVLQEAIDNMMYNLDKEENGYLLDWLTVVGTESVESGESWNFRKKLEGLAREIFRESFKKLRDDHEGTLIGKEEIDILKDELSVIKVSFENKLTELSNQALECIESHNLLPVHFKGGTRTPINFFSKVAAGDIPELKESLRIMADAPENLTTRSVIKKDPSLYNSIEQCWSDGLASAIEEICFLYDNDLCYYKSAVAALSNLQVMGIISDVERFVHEYTSEQNVVLIPETTELLNKIIDGSDAPFIYEKTGTRIDHFMLDEFQDTSYLQWKNFLPLVQDSLSRGMENLIVGDVKQSIYRWRGSDWSLLSREVYNDIPEESITPADLKHNWRSCINIIDFNNGFFPFAGRLCKDYIPDEESGIYLNAIQEISPLPRESEGYVWVKFVEKEEGVDWKERALELCLEKTKDCLKRGVEMREITYLVRSNDDGQMVANYLLQNGIPVISDEALLIGSAPVVRKIVAILKYIINPDDNINNTIARFLGIELSDALSMSHLPLYEMCEECIRFAGKGYGESDSVFLSSFMDLVLEQGRGDMADVASFVKWWEERGCKKSVPAPQGQDAVRVMTIHKAKGLGIPVVFIPFLDLQLDHRGGKGPILWCRPDVEPYSGYTMLPVKYSSKLQGTLFEEDYLKEKTRSYVDNLNLAYVAMTRAEKEMYMVCPPLPKKSDSITVSTIMGGFLDGRMTGDEYCSGELSGYVTTKHVSYDGGVAMPLFKSYEYGGRIKLALRGEAYYSDSSQRGWGVVMHRIMELIVCEDDLERAIETVLSEGILQPGMRDEVKDYIAGMFRKVRDRHWFDNSFRVFRELEILLPGGGSKRPDRVLMGAEAQIIDFKFGKKHEKSHIHQVRQYMSLVKQAGNAYVKGFVWYPDDNDIVEVSL